MSNRRRFGLCSWSIRKIQDGPPWEDAIKCTADMGYKATELIICQQEELKSYWKPRAEDIKVLCSNLGLRISQLAMFQPVVAGLASLDKQKRSDALDNVRHCAEIAGILETPILDFVSPWPIGVKAPVPYIPRYYYEDDIGGEPKIRMKLPDLFNWKSLWSTYIDTVNQCLDICREYNLTLSIENHLHTMIPGTDSFLRLWDSIKDPRLGLNMDIGWLFLGREYIPWSIHKVGNQLVNIHLRDCDGYARHFLCPGMGAVDWKSICEALDAIDYNHDINVELSEFEDREAIAKIALKLVGGFFLK